MGYACSPHIKAQSPDSKKSCDCVCLSFCGEYSNLALFRFSHVGQPASTVTASTEEEIEPQKDAGPEGKISQQSMNVDNVCDCPLEPDICPCIPLPSSAVPTNHPKDRLFSFPALGDKSVKGRAKRPDGSGKKWTVHLDTGHIELLDDVPDLKTPTYSCEGDTRQAAAAVPGTKQSSEARPSPYEPAVLRGPRADTTRPSAKAASDPRQSASSPGGGKRSGSKERRPLCEQYKVRAQESTAKHGRDPHASPSSPGGGQRDGKTGLSKTQPPSASDVSRGKGEAAKAITDEQKKAMMATALRWKQVTDFVRKDYFKKPITHSDGDSQKKALRAAFKWRRAVGFEPKEDFPSEDPDQSHNAMRDKIDNFVKPVLASQTQQPNTNSVQGIAMDTERKTQPEDSVFLTSNSAAVRKSLEREKSRFFMIRVDSAGRRHKIKLDK